MLIIGCKIIINVFGPNGLIENWSLYIKMDDMTAPEKWSHRVNLLAGCSINPKSPLLNVNWWDKLKSGGSGSACQVHIEVFLIIIVFKYYCADSSFKWRHWSETAAFTCRMIWLYFRIVGGSGGVLCLYTIVNGLGNKVLWLSWMSL